MVSCYVFMCVVQLCFGFKGSAQVAGEVLMVEFGQSSSSVSKSICEKNPQSSNDKILKPVNQMDCGLILKLNMLSLNFWSAFVDVFEILNFLDTSLSDELWTYFQNVDELS